MNYWQLDAIFLGVVAAVGCLALAKSSRGTRRPRPFWRFAILVLVLLAVTAIFDNVMIGIGLVGYDPAKISGAFIGVAPLEDFAYAIAAAILLPSVWILAAPRGSREQA